MTLASAGWLTPARPGPTRRVALLLLAACAAGFALWAAFGTGQLSAAVADEPQVREVTLRLGGDGRIRAGSAQSGEASVLERDGSRFTFTRLSVAPGAGTTRFTVDVPAGVPASAPTLRVRADGRRVTLRRTKDGDVPSATVEGLDAGEEVAVVVTVPARLLADMRDREATGTLDAQTRPVDAEVAGNRADQERLTWLRDAAWLIAALGVLLCVVVPLVLWRRARLRFFHIGAVPRAGKDVPAGPPGSMPAVDAAMLTCGTRRLDVADAFAGHVLELVDRELVRLMRTLDPREGNGVRFGLAAARDRIMEEGAEREQGAEQQRVLDAPAVHLLAAMSGDSGETAVLADSSTRLATRLTDPRVEPARREWAAAVERHARSLGYVEEPRYRRLFVAAVVAAAVGAVSVVAALVAWGSPGARATMLLAGVAALALAAVLEWWRRDARRWRRVAPLRMTERGRWLAWRAALGREGAPPADVRALPYAAATGKVDRVAPATAAPAAVGLAAATPATIEALRKLAGA
ncbi:MAG: hypothetical protein JWO69_332 [Thermoleophilia bacterium]|nr:hypothetical protein [Thermoleophilia bacterium]